MLLYISNSFFFFCSLFFLSKTIVTVLSYCCIYFSCIYCIWFLRNFCFVFFKTNLYLYIVYIFLHNFCLFYLKLIYIYCFIYLYFSVISFLYWATFPVSALGFTAICFTSGFCSLANNSNNKSSESAYLCHGIRSRFLPYLTMQF